MAYTDVISLIDAKTYLGVDDTSRDVEITRMIGSALKYLERRTNIIVDVRDKDYFFVNNCVRVYDYPINTEAVDLPEGVEEIEKQNYSLFVSEGDSEKITLSVGDNDTDDDLIEAAFILIDYYFHEGDRSKVPDAVESLIGPLRRYIV